MSVAESVAVLPNDVNQLKQMVVENHLKAQEWKQAYDKKEEERRELEAKFNLLRHAFFSRSSEKWTVDEKLQARLFDEAETAAEGETDTEPEVQMVAGYPRKNRGKRKPIPEDIPRDEIIYDIPEEEKACGCGAELTRIGEEVSEDLDIIPAELKATRHVRLKYGCRVCEGSGNEEGPAVKVAPGPKKLLAKSIATAGLVAHVVTSKYCDALPLYRQEKMFTRIGVDIKRSSMARWIIELGKRISPLLELMVFPARRSFFN